jgi:hypothetical protein
LIFLIVDDIFFTSFTNRPAIDSSVNSPENEQFSSIAMWIIFILEERSLKKIITPKRTALSLSSSKAYNVWNDLIKCKNNIVIIGGYLWDTI